ncbi:MAG TPA: hypothetical protein VGL21_02430 [Jatrophihabitantaceae bacterium]
MIVIVEPAAWSKIPPPDVNCEVDVAWLSLIVVFSIVTLPAATKIPPPSGGAVVLVAVLPVITLSRITRSPTSFSTPAPVGSAPITWPPVTVTPEIVEFPPLFPNTRMFGAAWIVVMAAPAPEIVIELDIVSCAALSA